MYGKEAETAIGRWSEMWGTSEVGVGRNTNAMKMISKMGKSITTKQ